MPDFRQQVDVDALERRLENQKIRALRTHAAVLKWHFRNLLFPACKRFVDISAALIMLVFLLPPAFSAFVYQGSGRRLFRQEMKVGRWGELFAQYILDPEDPGLQKIIARTGLSHFAAAINLLRGDLALVGPRAVSEAEARALPVDLLRRLDVKPGLLCLWWIKKRGNVGFDGEYAADREYVEKYNLKTDAAILLKALPTAVFGDSAAEFDSVAEILRIPLQNFTMNEAVDKVFELLSSNGRAQVCFVNADCANIAWKDSVYMKVLHNSAMNFADGIGLKIAGRLTDSQIKQNVNGTDLFPRLAKKMSGTGLGLYFLGARPEVNQALLQKTADDYPELKIVGGHHGYYSPEEETAIIQEINRLKPDLLLVAFGAPRQEKWIAEKLPELNVKVAMGVGGLFDFFSGRTERAPVWMREIGMEWFFRFLQEPQRMWRRYFIGNALFLYRVIRAHSGLIPPSINGFDKE